jgi:hypothetical protein
MAREGGDAAHFSVSLKIKREGDGIAVPAVL